MLTQFTRYCCDEDVTLCAILRNSFFGIGSCVSKGAKAFSCSVNGFMSGVSLVAINIMPF